MKPLLRPLAFLDTETTGLDTQVDRIITLAIEARSPEGPLAAQQWKFNPSIPIPPASTAIHHITDADVKDCPPFAAHAKDIHAALQGCDIGGFNTFFDAQILDCEFRRAGIVWKVGGVNILDVGELYKKFHPRRLENAVEQYLDRTHDGAHGALADTVATREVFEMMQAIHGDVLDGMTLAEAAHYSTAFDDGTVRLDLAGIIMKRADGVAVFGTKRNRGVPVVNDPGYADWMLRSDFPEQTKAVIEWVLSNADKQRALFPKTT